MLAVIIILSALVRIWNFNGYQGSDDGAYFEYAKQWSNSTYNAVEIFDDPIIFPFRVGVYVPTAWILRVIPNHEIAMISYPFILSILGGLLAYYAGHLFFGSRLAALIAAGIASMIPLDASSATLLLPDLPCAFWANFGIVLMVSGCRKSCYKHKIVYGGAAGFMFGLAWLCKASVAYILVFVAVYLLIIAIKHPRQWALAIPIGLVLGAIVLIECMAYLAIQGDFLYRLHMTTENFRKCEAAFVLGVGGKYLQSHALVDLLDRILISGPKLIFMHPSYARITCLAALGVVFALIKRVDKMGFPCLWFVCVLLIFNFGSTSLSSYQPLVLAYRYLYPLMFPAVLVTSGLIYYLLTSDSLHSKKFYLQSSRILAVVILLVAAWFSARGIHANYLRASSNSIIRGIAKQLRSADRIYSDHRTIRNLNFFWNYPDNSNTVNFGGLTSSQIGPDSYVLINRPRILYANRAYGYPMPEFFEKAPEHWKKVIGNSKYTVYFVSR